MVSRWMTIVCAMLLAASSAQANDTEIYSLGGELRPKQNTSIRLSYELIDLRINDGNGEFTISYRMINDSSASTHELAFVMLNPSWWEDEGGHEFVEGFQVSVNGEPQGVRWTPMGLDKDGRRLGAYVFTANFQPGVNHLEHRYVTQRSSSVAHVPHGCYPTFWLDYVLTTGANWKGGKIDTLDVRITSGDRHLTYVNSLADSRGTGWRVENGGEEIHGLCPSDTGRQTFWLDGGVLTTRCINFTPESNLVVGSPDNRFFVDNILSEFAEAWGPDEFRKSTDQELLDALRSITPIPSILAVELYNARLEGQEAATTTVDPVLVYLKSLAE